MRMDKDVFVCLDCETTGLDAVQDRVIEVAVCSFTLDEILESYDVLINPECQIPESSIEFHHITQEMVAKQPTIQEILPQVLRIIDQHIIVGHGISFDIQLLIEAAKRFGIPCTLEKNRSLDTLRMARLYGESPVNSLQELRRHFNIPEEGAHRAMSDVMVNIEVFRHLAKRYRTTQQMFEALEKPILFKLMPLGKYKGRPFKELPLDYLQWACRQKFDMDLIFSLRTEIKRRRSGTQFGQNVNPFSGL